MDRDMLPPTTHGQDGWELADYERRSFIDTDTGQVTDYGLFWYERELPNGTTEVDDFGRVFATWGGHR